MLSKLVMRSWTCMFGAGRFPKMSFMLDTNPSRRPPGMAKAKSPAGEDGKVARHVGEDVGAGDDARADSVQGRLDCVHFDVTT